MHLRRMYRGVRAIPNSIRFCFRYLPWRDALRLPVLVSHHVRFESMRGRVYLGSPAEFAMVRIGFGDPPGVDHRHSRVVWDVRRTGEVVFLGRARLGPGTAIVVGGTLLLGVDAKVTANTLISCHRRIAIGDRTGIAWDCMLMDADFHDIDGAAETDPIEIGADCWITARVTILKGVRIADHCIVAANSCVTRTFSEPHSLIAGNPSKLVRSGVTWSGHVGQESALMRRDRTWAAP